MRYLGVAATLAALGAAGCGLPRSAELSLVQNRCESAADCAEGATCAPVGENLQCVATQAELGALLVEARPSPMSVGSRAGGEHGASYLIPASSLGVDLEGSRPEGFAATTDIALPALVHINQGRVFWTAGVNDAPCPAKDESILADVTLRRVAPMAGLPSAEYTATSKPVEADGTYASYVFDVSVPPGDYAIYVRPKVPANCGSAEAPVPAPPPYFVQKVEIAGGGALNLPLPERKKLTGRLEAPPSLDITGWTLTLLEPARGLPISSTQTVVQSDLEPTTLSLAYHWSYESGASPVLRLASPDGRRSVHWELANIDLNGDSDVDLKLGSIDATSVQIDARVLDAAGEPVSASVSIQSVGEGSTKNVSFGVVTETDFSGRFLAQLFPSSTSAATTYDVFARPIYDDNRAIGGSRWTVPVPEKNGECFCGHVVMLGDKTRLRATLLTPNGAPMPEAVASFDPSNPGRSAYMEQVLGTHAEDPRKGAATVVDGNLSVALDPGVFDVSLRPAEGSGYPWRVASRLEVSADGSPVDLGALTLPYPVVLTGVLRDADGVSVAGASLRAWLPSGSVDDRSAGTLVVVAETVTALDGSYVLTLPPGLSP